MQKSSPNIKNELDMGLSLNFNMDHKAKGMVRKIAVTTFNGIENIRNAENT